MSITTKRLLIMLTALALALVSSYMTRSTVYGETEMIPDAAAVETSSPEDAAAESAEPAAKVLSADDDENLQTCGKNLYWEYYNYELHICGSGEMFSYLSPEIEGQEEVRSIRL